MIKGKKRRYQPSQLVLTPLGSSKLHERRLAPSKFAHKSLTLSNWAVSKVALERFALSKLQPAKLAPDKLLSDKSAYLNKKKCFEIPLKWYSNSIS